MDLKKEVLAVVLAVIIVLSGVAWAAAKSPQATLSTPGIVTPTPTPRPTPTPTPIKYLTEVTLTPSTTAPVVNQQVTFTTTLKIEEPTPAPSPPLSGKSVTIYHFLNGVRYTDTIKATNAHAQITFVQKFGSAGRRYYYATFAGDGSYASSTSSVVNVNVVKVQTKVALTFIAAVTIPTVNQQVNLPVLFTVKLYRWNYATNTWGALAGKPVTIWHTYKGVRYNDVTKTTDAYGKVTFVQKFGSVGVRYYYATFAGDSTYAGKSSSVLIITVH